MTTDTTSPFGRGLRHWRHIRGVSQLQLATSAGTTTRYVSYLETGRSRPSREVVERLCSHVAIISDGPPVLLNVASAPTFADAQAAITWSEGVTTSLKTDFKMKNLIGRGSGETLQMAFTGTGWVLVQPSEGRVRISATS